MLHFAYFLSGPLACKFLNFSFLNSDPDIETHYKDPDHDVLDNQNDVQNMIRQDHIWFRTSERWLNLRTYFDFGHIAESLS